MRLSALKDQSTHPHRVRAFATAAVLIVILGLGLGLFATSRGNSTRPWSTTAALTATTTGSYPKVLGEVFVSAGNPGWIVMTVDDDGWSGSVTCQVTLNGGKTEKIGRFSLANGYGTWGLPLTSTAHEIRSAQLISSNGIVIANAQLTT